MPFLSSKPSLRNLSTKRSESPVVVKPPYIPKHVGNPLPVDTVPFVVPETFQFFNNTDNSWANQTSLSFATSSNDYAYLHLEVVCSENCSSATSKSSLSHYGTGVIHGVGKSRTYSTISLSSTSSISSYGSSTAQTLYYPKNRHFDLDLICWKVIVKKALVQYLNICGQTIPSDIVHIINPRHPRNPLHTLDRRRRFQRRHLSSTSSQSSLSDGSDINTDPSYPGIIYKRRSDGFIALPNESSSRRSSTSSNDDINHSKTSNQELQRLKQYQQQQQEAQENPEAWICVPESELTNAWTALSGFVTSIDTGNYGTINVSVRVIRASRYMPSVSRSRRNRY